MSEIARTDARVRLIRQQVNGGPGIARNAGPQAAPNVCAGGSHPHAHRLLVPHFGAWAIFLVFERVLPIRGTGGSDRAAIFGCLLYVLLSALTGWVVLRSSGVAAGTPRVASLERAHHGNRRCAGATVLLPAALGLFGAGLQAYDKIGIQGINYAQGVAMARYAWAEAGQARAGAVSSGASVAGNLLAPLAVASMALLIVKWERVGKWARGWSAMWSALALASTSVLTGGRSILMVALGTMIAAAAVRHALGRSSLPAGTSGRPKAIAGTIGIGLSAVVWFGYVFLERAEATQVEVKEYVDALLPRLNAEPTEGYETLVALPRYLGETGYVLTAVGAYAVHGLYTFSCVATDTERPGTFLGAYIGALALKVGLTTNGPEPYAYYGLFLPLPGAVFYDFGWAGLCLGAVVHGAGLGLAMAFVRDRARGVFALGVVLSIVTTSVLAPVTVAFNTLIFPFVLVGFGLCDMVLRLWLGRRRYVGSTAW